ncbi:MAG: hypothetical protein COX62_01885 [Deltaproteobacteria bacterium CG_4_10_14_0_2_um_filter_43_8]|nr:MAG: hypothetical protein COV43_05610 [Deltaproteobacteria bacterium CG11_big_fil_rev_8_21_14_0_20_42_23]PJA21620.1 MAG: hypothetical protein COX62_01885 [Deltaproteobacteria bacterium CG_4_10_14_0_2_um_filter_43_8]PJC65262.1 MAG: hypothetical protein CO021_00035 [Deltaproteobacteria bacterium CG_4_9_14_0_2_um_filter_42_21]
MFRLQKQKIYPYFVSIFLLMAVCVQPSYAASEKEVIQEKIAAKLVQGERLLFAREYEAAFQHFQALSTAYPSSPAGAFGLMALNEVKMLEKDNFAYLDEFMKYAKMGDKIISQLMQNYKQSNWELMFSGSLIGLEGFFEARRRDWIGAYTLGTKSRQIFARIQKNDPQFADADFGMGMYLYWRSVFAKDLWFVPFVPDKRAEGIALIERVVKEGVVAKDLARIVLAIINLEEGNDKKGEEAILPFVQSYPDNILFRNIYGKILISAKQYEKAFSQFEHILRIEPQAKKSLYFSAVSLVLLQNPQRYEDAHILLERFLLSHPNDEWSSYAYYWKGRLAENEKKMDEAKLYYNQAVSLNSKLKGARFRLRALGSGL